jgi:hypothetical protein
MSTGFLSRWSRMKREAEQQRVANRPEQEVRQAREPIAAEKKPTETPAPKDTSWADRAKPMSEDFIGPIDSRAFLPTEIPEEMFHAALRHAWTSDPAIRDFVGLAENAWDFTAPDGVPGFGPLTATDGIARMLAEVSGQLVEGSEFATAESPSDQSVPTLPTGKASAASDGAESSEGDSLGAEKPLQTAETTSDAEKSFAKLTTDEPSNAQQAEHHRHTAVRRHGRALPE